MCQTDEALWRFSEKKKIEKGGSIRLKRWHWLVLECRVQIGDVCVATGEQTHLRYSIPRKKNKAKTSGVIRRRKRLIWKDERRVILQIVNLLFCSTSHLRGNITVPDCRRATAWRATYEAALHHTTANVKLIREVKRKRGTGKKDSDAQKT